MEKRVIVICASMIVATALIVGGMWALFGRQQASPVEGPVVNTSDPPVVQNDPVEVTDPREYHYDPDAKIEDGAYSFEELERMEGEEAKNDGEGDGGASISEPPASSQPQNADEPVYDQNKDPGEVKDGYNQPEGMPPVSEMPNNPLPPPAVNGVYDTPGKVYQDGFVAPNDENNPYHFDFSGYETFSGVPEGGWVDEHAFVWNEKGCWWWPFLEDGTNLGGAAN